MIPDARFPRDHLTALNRSPRVPQGAWPDLIFLISAVIAGVGFILWGPL